jgi:DMSO/TMAO reductase YedYZ molybdopterin-dependent catalytic subunit
MHSFLTRRDLIRAGLAGMSAAAMSHLGTDLLAAEPAAEGEQVVPFIDEQPIDPKRPAIKWEELKDWITPEADFFSVSHYGMPKVDPNAWHLKIEGDAIEAPFELDLACSGNGASAKFMGAIGNSQWGGVRLGEILKDARPTSDAVEVAFWGADSGKEKIREKEYEQNFARSLSIKDATELDALLAWEMNGQPLSAKHGYPLRLVVPDFYGIAWVKWINRIEVRSRRLMNRFMARDYVTIRGQRHGDQIEWKESSVARLNIKSLLGRIVRRGDGTLHITGAAWADSSGVAKVELKIDDGPWLQTQLEHPQPHTWTFWSHDWKSPAPGEHTLVSRATDGKGRVQPSIEDDSIKLKQTYWEANQQYPRKIRV